MPYDLSSLTPLMRGRVDGILQTEVAGVRLFWTTKSTPPAPLVYEPGLVILLRGRKDGSIGDKAFIYDESNYLTLTLPMPFSCAHIATPEAPLLGLFIDAVREDLSELLGQISAFTRIEPKTGQSALAPAPVSEDMRSAVQRLIGALGDPIAARAIGPSLRREILFHALRGPRGPALAAYAQQTGEDGKLDLLIESICEDFSSTVSIEAMAQTVGMSLSAFHRAFRMRTGQTPLQYIKRLRLHAAHGMIIAEGRRVGEAARRVGYESISQFSREYRRQFGEPPTACKTAVGVQNRTQ